ncbi:protein kinase family protein [Klebsormidium nitens]|uniref:Protein kinase family protein n=1 Tax=Klebsormidium nitens TaxID=105231 RepID=A0A0U9HJF9_KLENI|nr:protein kinase family protein [Klebsormidium nitens]|eukprot:GAQ80602.1 protein kinase family protein [Klebsormidium nitens]
MAGVLGLLEALCLRTYDIAHGAVSGALDPFCSSLEKLTFDELLYEVGRGALVGALEGLLGEEEGLVAVGGEGVVEFLGEGEEGEERGVEEEDGEEGMVFVGGEEEVEDLLEEREREEEMGRAEEESPEESGSVFEADADQRAASSPALAEAANSASAVSLAPLIPEHTHGDGQRDSGRAEEAPLEVSLPDERLFSGDAFAVDQIPAGFGDIFSDPAFSISRALSHSQLPLPVAPRRFSLPPTLAPQDSPVDELSWTEDSVLPPIEWEAVLAERDAAVSSLMTAVSESRERRIVILDGEEDMWRTALLREWTQGEPRTLSTTSSAPATIVGPGEEASLADAEDAEAVPLFQEVIPLCLLGRGGQGDVYHAACFDADGNYFPAAVKRARPNPETDTTEEQLRELSSLVACRGCANVLQALGYFIFEDGELGIVLELAEAPPSWAKHGATVQHTPPELLRIARYCYQGAAGLAAMHSRQMLHTDVKPENFLVSGEVAKLADLGFAVRVDRAAEMGACGTPGYIAPEVYVDDQHSKASDVFAMGVTVWALITGDRPSDYFRSRQECIDWYVAGGRLDWPDEVYSFGGNLVDLVEACWDSLPERRPSAHALMRALLQISLELEGAKKVWVG